MTTIGAGAVVLIATFMKDIVPTHDNGTLLLKGWAKIMLGYAVASFGVTVLLAVTGLLWAVWASVDESPSGTLTPRTVRVITLLVVYAFTLGLAAFSYVVFKTVIW
jgi:hypothetical protein